jgi:hypothetical protein
MSRVATLQKIGFIDLGGVGNDVAVFRFCM